MTDRPTWLTDADLARIKAGRNSSDQLPIFPPIISPENEETMLKQLNLHIPPHQLHATHMRGEAVTNPVFLMREMSKEVFSFLRNQYEQVFTPITNWIKSCGGGDQQLEDTYTMAVALVLRLCQMEAGPNFWDRLATLPPRDVLETLEGLTRNLRGRQGQAITIIDSITEDIPEIPPYQVALGTCVSRACQYIPHPYDDAFANAAAAMHGAIEHFGPKLRSG